MTMILAGFYQSPSPALEEGLWVQLASRRMGDRESRTSRRLLQRREGWGTLKALSSTGSIQKLNG